VTDQYVRLTPDRQSRRGGIWNGVPWKQGQEKLSFEVSVTVLNALCRGGAAWCGIVLSEVSMSILFSSFMGADD
jgi:hypothetical protein